MTRRVLQASAILLGFVLAFQAGRLSATPRPPLVIPATVDWGQSGPDRAGTEAPSDPGVAQLGERRGAGRETAEVPGSTPGPGVKGGASPSPTAAARVQTPKPVAPTRGVSVSGEASWYCLAGRSACTRGHPGGLYAAAGPALRKGDWRGKIVKTCLANKPTVCVRVKLIDWCACPRRVIDLYGDAFARLAPLDRGVLQVTVRRLG